VSDVLSGALEDDGIEILTGHEVLRFARATAGIRAELDDGRRLEADRVLVAIGRRPRTSGIGLSGAISGFEEGGPIGTDERGRVGEAAAGWAGRIWAAGDVTGVAPFTHTANYQARIVAADMAGEPVRADYRAVPRCVFTDPVVAAVGMTPAQARAERKRVAVETMDVTGTARAASDRRRSRRACLVLVADLDESVLLGASAVGPGADEWIGEAVLAVRAGVHLDVLADVIHPFPSYSEAYEPALRRLAALA